jgi:hypothetical protein
MGLPKLTIKLFPPKTGKSYAASGNLTIPISDVHAFAEWLLGQAGEYDDYLQRNVVRLLAFEYENRSRTGSAYRTIQLKDPADLSSAPPSSAHRSLSPQSGQQVDADDDEIPF